MAMKWILILFLSFICIRNSWSQNGTSSDQKLTDRSWWIEVEPFEFGYWFPRLGLGLERKSGPTSFWTMLHFGWDGLRNPYLRKHQINDHQYLAIEVGVRRIFSSSAGQSF